MISGRPQPSSDDGDGGGGEPAPTEGARRLLQGALPVWGRLDSQCAWREYAEYAGSGEVAAEVARFRCDGRVGWRSNGVAWWGRVDGPCKLLPDNHPPSRTRNEMRHSLASPAPSHP